MSINTMKLALEALENASPAAWASRVDSDTMKSIWRKHAEALEGLQVLIAELDNASCKSAQKRLEAQQPATGEPVASRNPFASRCYAMSESHLSGHRLIVGFEKLEDAQSAHEWIARYGRCDYLHHGITAQAKKETP